MGGNQCGGSTALTLGCGKVNDVAVALEHVDLLDSLDGLHVKLLEDLLELLVVGAGPLGCALHLPARGALAANARRRTELLETLLEFGHFDGWSGGGEGEKRYLERFGRVGKWWDVE